MCEQVPELIVGNYLVSTSFDGGKLTLSDSEIGDGWRIPGQLLHSPRIHSLEQIPHEDIEEWLVYSEPIKVETFDTMVNHEGFTPIDFPLEQECEHFWQQIVRLSPLHVLGENDRAYLVSRDEKLVKRIINS